jgi:serine/threonine protein kinase
MPPSRQALSEPIAGYRLLEPLGKGGFGEVWKCEAPGGLFKAIKFVFADGDLLDLGGTGADQELEALRHIRTIRHPFLLSMDRIEVVEGELVIVMELADHSLNDVLAECRAAGRPGIPRAALLAHLREAAEALDLLNREYGLQHLDVKPRNLLLVSRHVKVADFGLVCRLGEGGRPRNRLGPISPYYAAPEVFQGTLSPASDQYSLAITYYELLTGRLPFAGTNFRQLALQHAQQKPDLGALPDADRTLVARALAKEPRERFPTCGDFVRALLLERSPSAADFGFDDTLPRAETGDVGPDTAPVGPSTRLGDGERTERRAGAVPVDPGPADGLSCPDALSRYQFLECLHRGGDAEAWTAQTPEGGQCTVKFLYGLAGLDAAARAEAIRRLEGLRHPALIPDAVMRCDPARVVVVASRVGPTLRERWRHCRDEGRTGIPRPELLGHLRAAARALDALQEQHGLMHLGLGPDSLQLSAAGVMVADFGLAALFRLPAGQALAVANPRYAAPELWSQSPGRGCDSYSLALVYQEMLTGRHPFGDVAEPLTGPPSQPPDLTPLPEADRAVLARALDRAPARRFASCTELVRALEAAAAPDADGDDEEAPAEEGGRAAPEATEYAVPSVEQIIEEVIAGAAGGWLLQEHGSFRYLLQPGQCLRHTFVARLAPGTVPAALESFCRQRQARLAEASDELVVCQVPLPAAGWRRWLSRAPGLEIHLHLIQRPTLPAALMEVRIQVRPSGCGGRWAARLLGEHGLVVLEALRAALHAHPERRVQGRVAFDAAIEVCPVFDGRQTGAPIAARAKNVSRTGIALYLPEPPPTRHLRIFLPQGDGPTVVPVPARVVRVQNRDGRYEVGARFVFDGPQALA